MSSKGSLLFGEEDQIRLGKKKKNKTKKYSSVQCGVSSFWINKIGFSLETCLENTLPHIHCLCRWCCNHLVLHFLLIKREKSVGVGLFKDRPVSLSLPPNTKLITNGVGSLCIHVQGGRMWLVMKNMWMGEKKNLSSNYQKNNRSQQMWNEHPLLEIWVAACLMQQCSPSLRS